MVESRILQLDRQILYSIYTFSIFGSDLHSEILCDIVVAYVTLRYPLFQIPLSLFDLFFLGNPEYYNPGRKDIDSSVQITPITKCSGPFCPIQKSHMQSRMWNHACTFTFSHNAYPLNHVYGILA